MTDSPSRIPTLTCPSDVPQVDGRGITFHNYVANYGNTNHVGRDHLGPANPAWVKYSPGPFVGFDFGDPNQKTETSFKQITDGLSNTMLASETVQGVSGASPDYRGNTWWGWGAGFESLAGPNTSDSDYMQNIDSCNPVDPNPPCAQQTPANIFRNAARSRHPGGVNVVMIDGSVHFRIDNVDLLAWRAASTIQQGDLVQEF